MGEGGGKDHDGNHPRDAGDRKGPQSLLGSPQAFPGASYSFFFFLSMGEGKRGQFGKMSCVATLSAEGTAGISMGLLETYVFFFFGSVRRNLVIHVGFGPPLWFLLCCRPMRVVCIQAGGFGLASGEQLAQLLKGFTVPG